jgi:hypothetical protein
MKKSLVLAAGLAILATSSFAQTQVLSRNAVGYVKVDLLATNKLHLVRNDFEPLNGPIAISNTLASLPAGSQVLIWDDANQIYLAPIIKTAFGWGPGGTNLLRRGQAYFIRTANNSTNVPSYPLYLMGEVPDKNTAPSSTLSVAMGLNMDGYSYPVVQKWTNTQYSKSLPAGSQIIIWDNATQQYLAPIIKTAFGWGPSGNALTINPGQGFFVRATNSFVFSETKPYTWP